MYFKLKTQSTHISSCQNIKLHFNLWVLFLKCGFIVVPDDGQDDDEKYTTCWIDGTGLVDFENLL